MSSHWSKSSHILLVRSTTGWLTGETGFTVSIVKFVRRISSVFSYCFYSDLTIFPDQDTDCVYFMKLIQYFQVSNPCILFRDNHLKFQTRFLQLIRISFVIYLSIRFINHTVETRYWSEIHRYVAEPYVVVALSVYRSIKTRNMWIYSVCWCDLSVWLITSRLCDFNIRTFLPCSTSLYN